MLIFSFLSFYCKIIIIFKCRTSASDWALHFGKLTQSATSIHEVTRPVSQVIIHPDYNNNTFDMDIGLLKLSSPVTFTDYIRPICLASNSSQFLSSTMCWATGWGKINSDGECSFLAPSTEVRLYFVYIIHRYFNCPM